jgi:hypothetical protein
MRGGAGICAYSWNMSRELCFQRAGAGNYFGLDMVASYSLKFEKRSCYGIFS